MIPVPLPQTLRRVSPPPRVSGGVRFFLVSGLLAAGLGLVAALSATHVEDCSVFLRAAERVTVVAPEDLAAVPDGQAVAVSGFLDVPNGQAFADPPFVAAVPAFVLERRVEVRETRFQRTPSAPGTRYRAPVASQLQSETVWTRAGETDGPRIDGAVLQPMQWGALPHRLGPFALFPSDPLDLPWTPVPVSDAARAMLAAQGFAPDPDAPGWWVDGQAMVRVGWFAFGAQPMTLAGIKATSPFDDALVLEGGSIGGLDWPRRVRAGRWDAPVALRRDHDHCRARALTLAQRLRIGRWHGIGTVVLVMVVAFVALRWRRARSGN